MTQRALPNFTVRCGMRVAEKAIRAIVADQVAAWDEGDAARYPRHVSADASFTNIFGMMMYGAPAFLERSSRR